MSGPRMTLAPLIRVLVSSDGSWSRQPSLVFRNIEVMDSRAHLEQQVTNCSLPFFHYFTCRCEAKCPRQQNLLPSYIQNFSFIKKDFIKAGLPFLLKEVAELQGAGIHRVYVEHGGARPHHVHLHEGPHLLPSGTVGPHQTLGRLVHVTTHLCKNII